MNVCGTKVDFKWPVSSVIFNLATTTDSGLLTDSHYPEIVRLSVCQCVLGSHYSTDWKRCT